MELQESDDSLWETQVSVLCVHTVPTVCWGSGDTEQGPQETLGHGWGILLTAGVSKLTDTDPNFFVRGPKMFVLQM